MALTTLVLTETELSVALFLAGLQSSKLTLKTAPSALQTFLRVPHLRLRLFQDVLAAATDIDKLCLSLETAAAVLSAVRDSQPQVQLAWTYPGERSPGLRTTEGVARELVDASKTTLLVVGFAVSAVSNGAGLAAQTLDAIARAAARGVVVTAVLHRDVSLRSFLHACRPGAPRPSVFTWPASDDAMAAMHAKLVVGDRSHALVTSANLTYHGLERNLEMGVRISGHPAAEIHDRFDELIATGVLVPWTD